MRAILEFVKKTLIGGVLFLLPIAAVIILLKKLIDLASSALAPVVDLVPVKTVVGVTAVEIAAIVALVLIGFLAGLLAQTSFGTRVREKLERVIMRKLPGYTLLQTVVEGPDGTQHSDVAVAVARLDDAWLLAFILEKHDNGLLTVFIPSAPTPAAGSLYFLTEEQVKRIDVPVAAAMKCVMQFGVGSRDLLRGQVLTP